ncbi:MAG: hypothetical protein M3R38_31155 [Actinomycetota bacterium]|nr:hypothetical protein [Actinomycetota bacterium]
MLSLFPTPKPVPAPKKATKTKDRAQGSGVPTSPPPEIAVARADSSAEPAADKKALNRRPAAAVAEENLPSPAPRPAGALQGVVALGPSLAASRANGEEGSPGEPRFMGHLLQISVADTHLTRDAMQEALAAAGFDGAEAKELMPKNLSDRGAFRKAASRAEASSRRVHLNGPNGPYANVLVREVKTGAPGGGDVSVAGEEIVRHVVREVVDSSQVQLSYAPVIEVELGPPDPTRQTGKDGTSRRRPPKVSVRKLSASHATAHQGLLAAEEGAVERLLEDYEFTRLHYDTDAVRRLLMASLTRGGCYPVSMRGSGGLYFVLRTKEETVRRTVGLAGELAARGVSRGSADAQAGGYVQAVAIPFVDESEYRDVVAVSLEDQVKKESGELLEDIRAVLKGDLKLGARRKSELVERVRALSKNVKEYEEVLKAEISGARSALELAGTAAMQMMDRPDEEDKAPNDR